MEGKNMARIANRTGFSRYFIVFIAVAALCLSFSCSREKEAVKAQPAPKEAGLTTLTGTIGCGHCTYHLEGLESCALAMQTEDGKQYVIEGAPNHDALYDERFSEKSITVTGEIVTGGSYNIIKAKTAVLK
jgi:hypothetical protein